ncbi:hypothetical protein E3J84_01175, partial [Candidatus Aerophobetes bacterium]
KIIKYAVSLQPKEERCWNYSSHVGENKEHLTLCERCWKVVE